MVPAALVVNISMFGLGIDDDIVGHIMGVQHPHELKTAPGHPAGRNNCQKRLTRPGLLPFLRLWACLQILPVCYQSKVKLDVRQLGLLLPSQGPGSLLLKSAGGNQLSESPQAQQSAEWLVPCH